MDDLSTGKAGSKHPWRIWPGALAAGFLVFVRFLVPQFVQDSLGISLLGGLFFALVIIIWWAFFSRLPKTERWGGLLFIVLTIFLFRFLIHKSIAQAGLGFMFPVLALPLTCIVLPVWAFYAQNRDASVRRISLGLLILLSAAVWLPFKTGGINNSGESDLSWRWSPTPEDRLVAQGDEPLAVIPDLENQNQIKWPGFRGADRSSIVSRTAIHPDWKAAPPNLLWRRPVGPGWSSFAVMGDLFYTQEQRGENEMVTCYRLDSGEQIWRHSDRVRFWESNAGAGPRGTPSLTGNRVAAVGASGLVNVLDAYTGEVVWSRNAVTDAGTDIPIWGISSSPLILDDQVIIAAACTLISYALKNGEILWMIEGGVECYSSPHGMVINGFQQILMQKELGLIGVQPKDGRILWMHEWKGYPIVQPSQIMNGELLTSIDERKGIRRISVSLNAGEWAVSEHWHTQEMTPYFNDSVIHNDSVYGYDGGSLACVNLETGSLVWKGGDYGRGQLMLLADQNLLLVLTESGELALVDALPDGWNELSRVPGITGKTWNHPVLTDDVLLIRNGEEMAAFRLAQISS